MTPSRNNKAINQNLVVPSEHGGGHVLVRPNVLVPAAMAAASPNRLGRETLYEPVLVLSPIYASRRHSNQHHGLITATEMDGLAQQLHAMLLGTVDEGAAGETEAPDDAPAETEAPVETTMAPPPVVQDTITATTSGRYQDTVFSPKAKRNVPVKRSLRLK
uniref:Uncharacterized protein n=1 Tax=Amphora coffeiformis TaxID=265554 RepID=A0A7S3KYR8_9STRA|mmetsp:Transcript_756/g.1427  ORF Transcript_756/g.1427 Transcript_756/m.1427 type:complete len:161 (+) Transcript_756:232-714(+)|eukprot:scaffold10860_cov182-Amphora_coffeaeformis.AAC.24